MVVEIQNVKSAFQLYSYGEFWPNLNTYCKENSVLKDGSFASVFQSKGYTKFTCVYGVLIAGDANYPDNNLLFTANVLQNLLNKDCSSDFPIANKSVRDNLFGYWLNGGSSQQIESQGDSINGLYGFGLQNWKGQSEEESKKITIEEAFHMVHQIGWGSAYPSALGVQNFVDSIACREAARLMCVSPGWWHEENTCPAGSPRQPGNPASAPLQGTCASADCDCVEFFHQAALMSIGQTPGWFSDYMPQTQSAMNAMLSQEFKNMIKDPQYGLPTEPFNSKAMDKCSDAGPTSGSTDAEKGYRLFPSLPLTIIILCVQSIFFS